MKFKLHPEKGLLVKSITVGWPLAEQAAQGLIAWGLKETGKLPTILEKNGEQYVSVTMNDGHWYEVDGLLGTPLVVDGVIV